MENCFLFALCFLCCSCSGFRLLPTNFPVLCSIWCKTPPRVLYFTLLQAAGLPVTLYLKHTPSLGDSGSTYILNTPPPHLVLPLHHMSSTPLLWPFRLIIHHKHAPSFGVSGSSYILNMPPSFGHSGSSYIINTPPHLAIPDHHIS